MSAPGAVVASAPAFPCIVCTARGGGAPLCDHCLVALSDAVPAMFDCDLKTEEARAVVRRDVAHALSRSRDDALLLESYRRGSP